MNKVAYIQYTNPAAYPPLERSSRMFGDSGWQVLFLGTRAVEALRFVPHPNVTIRLLPFCHPGWMQKAHYFLFCLWVLQWILRWRPEWAYVSDPLSTPIGLVLTLVPRLRVMYHEHDSPLDSDHVPATYFMRLVLWSRRQLGTSAPLCVLPNGERARRFALQMDRNRADGHFPTIVVWNCPALDEISPRRRAKTDADILIYYHGSVTPSLLPETVLEALTALPERVKLNVVGYETIGHRGYVKHLMDLGHRIGIDSRLRFHGWIPRRELLPLLQGSDVGLALKPMRGVDSNFHFNLGASNKPFDYLACGLALLVSDLPDWREMYVEPGYGLSCNPDDPESIAKVLRWFLEHPAEMRGMGERGRQRILAEWNYEGQFAPVLLRMSTST